ncbi:MAG: 6-phosphofructokinase [Lachnospiraceae bacterium]|nr:6-phosphofructokinase [Lachnospiraceae bacterium]
MEKKNCVVAQSGGPTVAINSSLAGVIQGVIDTGYYEKVYGSIHGVMGLLNDNLMDCTLKARELPNFIELLKKSPSMYLGSCRYQLPDYDDDDAQYAFIFNKFKEYNIGAFFYIGGNDSMDTVDKLSKYGETIGSDVRIIGIPKTIDNDLCITDHTPGFGSAAKYVASTLLEIGHDTSIYPIKSITIVEIMGRDAGWLAGSSILARNEYNSAPHLVYLPEVAFDKDKFLEDVKDAVNKYHNIVIAVSEGIKDADGKYISASTAVEDTFGHSQLSGTGKCLEYIIKQNMQIKVRSVEINILQRSAAHMSSVTDIGEAFRLGYNAVNFAIQGETGIMVTLKRRNSKDYNVDIEKTPVENVAGLVKHVPREWINERGNNMTEEFFNYVYPLIQGEPVVPYKNGIPDYLDVAHLYPNSNE